MKIGILKCDSTNEKFRKEHGDYPDMFISLFQSVEPTLEFETYDVILGEYPKKLQENDVYLISGSRYGVNDGDKWIDELEKFVLELQRRKHPLIGICFGHQMIAKALGGKTELASQGWGAGVQNYQKILTEPWMVPNLEQFSILSFHKDQVTKLPEGAEFFAENDFCPYSAYYIGEWLISFQGHPELTKDYVRALLHHRENILGQKGLESGLKSLEQQIQPKIIAKWILNFIDNGITNKQGN